MSKSAEWPKCGTCDLKIKNTNPGAGKDEYWCRGGPPSAFIEKFVDTSKGAPVANEMTRTTFPPVHSSMTGCAMHPVMRAKLKAGGRVL